MLVAEVASISCTPSDNVVVVNDHWPWALVEVEPITEAPSWICIFVLANAVPSSLMVGSAVTLSPIKPVSSLNPVITKAGISRDSNCSTAKGG